MPVPANTNHEAPKSAKIRIYETLREWIIDGTLEPGEKILDSELSRYFSVSRTPVREAVQMLAEQKLIDVRPGKESRVSEIDVTDMPQTYRMLAELHSMALDFAFDRIDADIIAELRSANAKLQKAYQDHDIKACRSYDKEFHDIILRAAANDFLTSFCETLSGHTSRIENIYYTKAGRMSRMIDEHEEIISAIESKDPEKARSFMQRNWLHTAEVVAAE